MASERLGSLYTARGEIALGKAAYAEAIGSGRQVTAARAAYNLGCESGERGEFDEALSMYAYAKENGDNELAAKAAVNSGAVFADRGQLDQARQAFVEAMLVGWPESVDLAASNLRVLLKDEKDPEVVKGVFAPAIQSSDGNVSAVASYSVGEILFKLGDLAGALEMLRPAVASNHPDVGPRAILRVGEILLALEVRDTARAVLIRARASAHQEVSREASRLLTRMEQRGADDTLTRDAKQSTPSETGPADPRLWTAICLEEEGRTDEAMQVLDHLLDLGDIHVALEAGVRLASLLDEAGDYSGAKRVLVRTEGLVADGDVPVVNLFRGVLLVSAREDESAVELLRGVVNSDNERAAHSAIRLIHDLGEQEGHGVSARPTLRQVLEGDRLEYVPRAALRSGAFRLRLGDVAGAKASFAKSADLGHPSVSPSAAGLLGILLAEENDFEGAKRAFGVAARSADQGIAQEALMNLGFLLVREGDLREACSYFRRAINGGDAANDAESAALLSLLLFRRGQYTRARKVIEDEVKVFPLDDFARCLREASSTLATLGNGASVSRSSLDTFDRCLTDALKCL
jgi:tetratricopeptide (TPR) repeat protein